MHGEVAHALFWNLPETPAQKRRGWKVRQINNWLSAKGVAAARVKTHQKSGRVFVDRYPLCSVVLQVSDKTILNVVDSTFQDLDLPFTKADLESFYAGLE